MTAQQTDLMTDLKKFQAFCVQFAAREASGRTNGLGSPERLLLVALLDQVPVSLKALSVPTSLDYTQVSRSLTLLERSGLVELLDNQEDRRYRSARLTPEGRRRAQLLQSSREESLRQRLNPLDKEEQLLLVQAMRTVVRLLSRPKKIP